MKKLIAVAFASLAVAGCDPQILVYGDSHVSPIYDLSFDDDTWQNPMINTCETPSNITVTIVFNRKNN